MTCPRRHGTRFTRSSSVAESSLADEFRLLPVEVRQARLADLTDEESSSLLFDWDWWARPSQKLPGLINPRTADGDWIIWMPLAGRGWGKTRVGAETVRFWVRQGFNRVNLIGATADDARDIMIEGESGILACCPKAERPIYVPSKRRLEWPNGSKSLIFTADEPERLRGKQHAKLWGDELAAWRYPEAWDQASLGLRLGKRPQAVITTTPRPTKLVKEIVADPNTILTKGSTYDNRANLAPTFIGKIITKYEGTRLGRQELNAEILEDNPGALWNHAEIDSTRIKLEDCPTDLLRIVVGVDPAVTSNEDSDLTGIVVAGRDHQSPPHFYVMDDLSLIAKPMGWATASVHAYLKHKADRIVAETNNGGDLVEAMVRGVTIEGKPEGLNVSYSKVTATRGKQVRAEPISALYEQGRVHHVGTFVKLEDEMCDWDPVTASKSPDRMDALVWALTELSSDGDGMGLFLWMQQEAEAQKALEEKAKRGGSMLPGREHR